ncbi:RNA polymerase-binding protein DksA [Candidatus Kinetoplastidibacterium stringomonadis]|nr:RNA polymerase-binding protein DksA [Candidatus Kinetoplastibacterium oncopeltii]
MKNNDKNTSQETTNVRDNNLLRENYILSMPEDKYMNDEQLSFFKNKLKQLEQEILLKAEETTEYLRETQFVPDPADRATIEEEHTIELRTRDRERKLLKKIQISIARIENGEYGWCEETGEPIGIPRLLARPTATLSLEAQERREIRQKLYGE